MMINKKFITIDALAYFKERLTGEYENKFPLIESNAASIIMEVKESESTLNNYIITTKLVNKDGNTIGTEQKLKLPFDLMVKSGAYDEINKKIILTLQNGSTIDINISSLVNKLTSMSDKLDAIEYRLSEIEKKQAMPASESHIGGVIASPRDPSKDTSEVKIDTESNKLYVSPGILFEKI